jgi:hypothetical protein
MRGEKGGVAKAALPFTFQSRKEKAPTRQSSGTIRQPPHRPGIPHDALGWIAASVLFETFLAMTKK